MQMFIGFDLYFPAWTCFIQFVSSSRCYCPLHCVSCIEMFILIVPHADGEVVRLELCFSYIAMFI
jgi:hypothetical protein